MPPQLLKPMSTSKGKSQQGGGLSQMSKMGMECLYHVSVGFKAEYEQGFGPGGPGTGDFTCPSDAGAIGGAEVDSIGLVYSGLGERAREGGNDARAPACRVMARIRGMGTRRSKSPRGR